MYAIINISGKQYKVVSGARVRVPKQVGETGSNVTFEKVLLISDGKKAHIGDPFLKGATVTGTIVDHGRDKNGNVKSWGRNSRLDNFQAAVLNFNLKSYEKVIQRRREIASKYHSRLSSIEELKLPESPEKNSDHYDVFQNYEIVAQRRDELQQHLRDNGIGTLIQWGGKAIHQWEHLGFNVHLPKAEAFFKECIMIPMNMFISNNDVDYICEKITEFYRK